MRRVLLTALFATLFASSAAAQQLPAPVGLWRCVMNSAPASIDLQVQIAPDGSLFGQGSYILNQTSFFQQIQAPGRWLTIPAGEPEFPNGGYQLSFVPPNVASFSLFLQPTTTPGNLYNLWQNPQTGDRVETACQKLR